MSPLCDRDLAGVLASSGKATTNGRVYPQVNQLFDGFRLGNSCSWLLLDLKSARYI